MKFKIIEVDGLTFDGYTVITAETERENDCVVIEIMVKNRMVRNKDYIKRRLIKAYEKDVNSGLLGKII